MPWIVTAIDHLRTFIDDMPPGTVFTTSCPGPCYVLAEKTADGMDYYFSVATDERFPGLVDVGYRGSALDVRSEFFMVTEAEWRP